MLANQNLDYCSAVFWLCNIKGKLLDKLPLAHLLLLFTCEYALGIIPNRCHFSRQENKQTFLVYCSILIHIENAIYYSHSLYSKFLLSSEVMS